MAAVGCGSVVTTTVSGPSNTVSVRGRFPGRPWTSRSRLRSEKRLQIGRSWTVDEENATGGPRPTGVGLTLNDDPTLLRLLGMVDRHKHGAEAGYSSSGSEEGEDFKGFEVQTEGNHTKSLRSENKSSNRYSLNLESQKLVEGSHPEADQKETATVSSHQKKGSKPPQEPRRGPVAVQPLKNGKKLHAPKVSIARVKLMKGKQLGEKESLAKAGFDKKRATTANKGKGFVGKAMGAGSGKKKLNLEGEGQSVHEGRSLDKSQLVTKKGAPEGLKRTCGLEYSEASIGATKPKGQRHDKKASQNDKADGSSMEELESLGKEGSPDEPLSKGKIKADKAFESTSRKGSRTGRTNRKASAVPPTEPEKLFGTKSLAIEGKSQDLGVPGLKLKRVRNPRAVLARSASARTSSQDLKDVTCKKQSKFVWTLTLVKGREKVPKRQDSGEKRKGEAMITDENTADFPVSGPHKCSQQQQMTSERGRKMSSELGVGKIMKTLSNDAGPENVTDGKDVVPPLKLKVVSSPSKQRGLYKSLVICPNDCDVSKPETQTGNSSGGSGDSSTLTELNDSLSHKTISISDIRSVLFPSPKGGNKSQMAQKEKVQRVSDSKQPTDNAGRSSGVEFASCAPQLADGPGITKDLFFPKDEEGLEYEGTETSEAAKNVMAESEPKIKVEMTGDGDGFESSEQPTRRIRKPFKQKRRKSIFGYRRKPDELPVRLKPNCGPKRIRRKIVTFVYEPISDASEGGANAEQSHSATTDCLSGAIQDDPLAVVSARSSRVIKTPKRFIDDDDMYLLPSRMIPKKGLLSLHPRSTRKKDDGSLEDIFSFLDDEDFVAQPVLKSDDTEVSQTMETYCGPQPKAEGQSSGVVSGKRKTPLREPNFKWRMMVDPEEEISAQHGMNQLSYRDLMSTESISAPAMPRKKISKLTQHSALKIYEKLKKLTSGASQKKVKEGIGRKYRSSMHAKKTLCSVQEGQPRHLGLSPFTSTKRRKRKAKLKMKDLDSPGVVRKVAVHVRANPLVPGYGTEMLEGDTAEGNSLTPADPIKREDYSLNLSCPEPKQEQVKEREQVVVEEKGTAHRISLSSANKKMFHLLKRAKVQLIKIDQQKQLKTSQALSGSAHLGSQDRGSLKLRKRRRVARTFNKNYPPQEQPLGGPRIKHVCRAAAVALGQPRAMVPDDIPRLSALPLHERAGITPSPALEDVGSPSEPESPTVQEYRTPKVRRLSAGSRNQGDYGPSGLRSRRCGRCKGCLHEDDCGECINCLDKPKFGGPNTKRQCCVHRRCDKIEERKARRMGYKPKGYGKRQRLSTSACHSGNEDGDLAEEKPKPALPPPADEESPSLRKQPRRGVKPRSYCDLLDSDSDLEATPGSSSASLAKRKAAASRRDWASVDDDQGEASGDAARLRRPGQHRPGPPGGRRRTEKSPLDQTPPSVLAAIANRFTQRERDQSKPSHKIRVDFKEDCSIQNVWLMGGLSILASNSIIPQQVCLLCASKGQHQMLFCQVCCEPFHGFCLDPAERPLEENKENWCCRRCKFCHVCGRKNKLSKSLLECGKCQKCYHFACLGPNYPKPSKCKTSWTCMSCIRCRGCDGTPGKSFDTEWDHERSLCPDCSWLHDQGNFCPICFKCYEENDYESQMIQCSLCNHWVHAKCEGLSDDLYEILSNLPESVEYTCTPCSRTQPSGWRAVLQEELRAGLEKVLSCLLTSSISQHLVRCGQCTTYSDPETRLEKRPVCDLLAISKKFGKGLYTTLKSFHEDVVHVIVKRLEKEKADESIPEEKGPTTLAKAYYFKMLQEVFSWLNSSDFKAWYTCPREFPPGMLPNAVLPPSSEHLYAHWRERENPCASEPGDPKQGMQGTLELTTYEGPSPVTPATLKSLNHHAGVTGGFHRFQEKRGRQVIAGPESSWITQDERQCSLCQKYGDAKPNDAGRLLYLGQNEWAHLNCALWSAEVYEDNGSLMHVHSAVTRGRLMRCERCNQTGATVGCCLTSCQSNYHFMCARLRNCVFQDDKKVFCQAHRDLITEKVVSGNGFEVLRRVFVDFEGISLRRKFLTGLEPESVTVMIGSLLINNLGVLTELSASKGKLFPVGYECSRWYWSTLDPRRRCRYTCKVKEVRPPVLENPAEEPLDQGDNHTIAHDSKDQTETEMPEPEMTHPKPPPLEAPPGTESPTSRPDVGAVPKVPTYTQARRPAGGICRPLPSPGNASSKSHKILTIGDLEEARRPRRHGPISHGFSTRSRMSSPLSRVLSEPISLRSGRSLHSKSHQASSPLSPLSATENLQPSSFPRRVSRNTASVRGLIFASHSTSELPSVSSPPALHGIPCSQTTSNFPMPRLSFENGKPDLAELPQDTSIAVVLEDAAKVNRPYLPKPCDGFAEEHGTNIVSEQEFPCASFDVDSDVAVSVLNSKLEFSETLQNESSCEVQIVVGGEEMEVNPEGLGEAEDGEKATVVVKGPCHPKVSAKDEWGNISSNDDMDNYFDFSRTVVSSEAPRDSEQAPVPPSANSIPQLDGIDDGTESDASEATNDGNRNLKSTNQAQNLAQLPEVPPKDDNQGNGLNHLSTPSPSPACLKGQLEAASYSEESLTSTKAYSSAKAQNENMPIGSLNASCTHQDAVPLLEICQETISSSGNSPMDVDPEASQAIQVTSDLENGDVEHAAAQEEPTIIFEMQTVPAQGMESSTQEASSVDGGLSPLQGSDSEMVSGKFLVCESSELGESSAAYNEHAAGSEEVAMDSEPSEIEREIFLDPDSGHFVADDGTILYLTERQEDDDSPAVSPVKDREVTAYSLTGSSILQQNLNIADSSRASPSIPPTTSTVNPAPVTPGMMSRSPSLQTVLTTMRPSTCYKKQISNEFLPVSSTPVRILPTSPTTSTHSFPVLNTPSSAPIVINGLNPALTQRNAPRTISINISRSKPMQSPQERVMSQTPQGHTIFTVREIGSSSVEQAPPQMLLVNSQGQIFTKNPESNSFQLPTSNCPSFSHINKIASLLQGGRVSITPCLTSSVPQIQRVVSSPQVVINPATPTHIVTYRKTGLVTARSMEGHVADSKKPMRRGAAAKKRPKSDPQPDPSVWSVVSGRAEAIISQALTNQQNSLQNSNLNPSHFRVQPASGGVQALSPMMLPSGLRLQPEPTTPHSHSQVRVKRVSSALGHDSTKKAKVAFADSESPDGLEERHKASCVPVRLGGVRIKMPTAKEDLDLDRLKDNYHDDFKNTGSDHWNRPLMPQKPSNCDDTRRRSLTDSDFSSASLSSDDETPELEEETLPNQDQPHLRFEITSDDGFSVEADSIEVAWRTVVEGVQEARADYRLKQLSCAGVSGARMLGVLHDAVLFLLEQLQGAARCQSHRFRFHRQERQEEELPINPSGCARAEVHLRKSTFDMFNFLASQHRQLPDIELYDEEEDEVPLKSTRRATSLELPMAMRYRHLERTSKEAVGVYRSAIHGRGLFCKRNIDAGEMVIEYAGMVIRAVLTDKREKYYDSKGIGCYMFRIDDFDVVDATMYGNAARFINHSCEPNCYSRVINVEGQKHIVIFALRKIYRGEELTYDYKFPIEDDSSKLLCNCGARRCRRFLN
ncbi:hypothetical protein GJAV_G00098840 [Gymnothorax javanicus]|nr:hypothetical protein GJAV_G00098840 [Gymnothorax javanicus]